jgi:ribosome-binding factor A
LRKNSIKNIRINEEVLRELSDIIRNKVKDPRIAPVTSVTGVEVAPDLKTCKIWISVLGDEEAEKKTMEGLNSSKNFIRHELARTVNLRNTPELFFHLDTSIAYGVHMSKMIDEVNHGLKVSDLDKADKKED